jgi:hypothetical protein
MRYVLKWVCGKPIIRDRLFSKWIEVPAEVETGEMVWSEHFSRMAARRVPVDPSFAVRALNKHHEAEVERLASLMPQRRRAA